MKGKYIKIYAIKEIVINESIKAYKNLILVAPKIVILCNISIKPPK